MNFLFINTPLLQKIFYTKDHFLGAANKKIVGAFIINQFIQFNQLVAVYPSRIDGRICFFPAKYINEIKTVQVPVL